MGGVAHGYEARAVTMIKAESRNLLCDVGPQSEADVGLRNEQPLVRALVSHRRDFEHRIEPARIFTGHSQ